MLKNKSYISRVYSEAKMRVNGHRRYFWAYILLLCCVEKSLLFVLDQINFNMTNILEIFVKCAMIPFFVGFIVLFGIQVILDRDYSLGQLFLEKKWGFIKAFIFLPVMAFIWTGPSRIGLPIACVVFPIGFFITALIFDRGYGIFTSIKLACKAVIANARRIYLVSLPPLLVGIVVIEILAVFIALMLLIHGQNPNDVSLWLYALCAILGASLMWFTPWLVAVNTILYRDAFYKKLGVTPKQPSTEINN